MSDLIRDQHIAFTCRDRNASDGGATTTNVFASEISHKGLSFDIEIVRTPQQLREVFQLRHQVYCLERGFERSHGNEETDEFDARSRHVLLRDVSDGTVLGTVRLIAPNARHLGESFPVQRLCQPGLLDHVPLRTTGEISRFAISKQRRGGCEAGMQMRLALMRGIAELSCEMGLTHWLALMERGLMRLQRRNSIYFDPIGPLVSYHGLRQPTSAEITTVLNRIKRDEFPTWSFLTDGGRWCGSPAAATAEPWRNATGDDSTSEAGYCFLPGLLPAPATALPTLALG